MEFSFWLGLLISIPLSIIANIWAPKFQLYLDRRQKNLSTKRIFKIKKEFDSIKGYYENRDSLQEYMIYSVIRTTYISAFLSIISIISNSLGFSIYLIKEYIQMPTVNEKVIYSVSIISQIITLISSLIIVRICSSIIRIYSNVKNFDNYKEQVTSLIGET